MSRRLGEYVPLSVTFPDDDAILSVTPLAELLYVRVLPLALKAKADGYVTEAQVLKRASRGLGSEQKVRKLIAELVAQKLWLDADGGWIVRAWLKWNKSMAELGQERARDRDRKREERSGQDSLWDESDQDKRDPVRVDTTGTPDGIQEESGQNPGGVQVDSPSRAGVRAEHGTARHGTEEKDGAYAPPPETAGQRVNRLARVYTDVVKISRFPAVAGIVRKAVDAGYDDESITVALKKIIAENRSLTTETLRIAIMGGPNGRGSPHQPYRNVTDQTAYDEELRPA